MSTFLVMRELMLQLSRLSLPITNMKLPRCDLIPRVSNYCLREWQEIWSNCVNNKLYAIYQTVGSVVHNKGLSRHESVIINRLGIGHTRLTHGVTVGKVLHADKMRMHKCIFWRFPV